MHGVVTHGTGTKANLPNDFVAGKTGTTENYGDAWFVGFNEPLHRRGLGRLPRQAHPDEDAVPAAARSRAAPSRPRSGTTSCVSDRDLRTRATRTQEPAARHHHRSPVGATGPASPSTGTSAADSGAEHRPGQRRSSRLSRTSSPRTAAPRTPDRRSAARRRPTPGRQRPSSSPPAAADTGGAAPAARGRARRHAHGHRNAHAGPAGRQRATPRMLGGQRARDERLRAIAKRQGSSTALVMPIRSPTARVSGRSPSAARQRARWARRRAASCRSARARCPSAWVSLPGPEQSSWTSSQAAPLAHQVDAVDRLERPDQHGGAHALRLADRVQQGVDAVRAVDVGAARADRTGRRVRGVRPTNAWQAGSSMW